MAIAVVTCLLAVRYGKAGDKNAAYTLLLVAFVASLYALGGSRIR